MSSPLDFLSDELKALERKGLRRTLETLDSPQGAEVTLADGSRVLNFCSNDYLSLAADPRLADAAARALLRWGSGAGASRLLAGDLGEHLALESAIAELKGTEAALLFNSGWHANVGTIPALVGDGDVVVSDALNHASIIDGARLSKARITVVPHRDLDAFEKALKQPARRKLVVTDSLFSMDGTIAPLRELRALCDAYGAILYVDEAHATGVFGKNGAGLAEAFGIRPDVQMGTLGKALGSFGAFIAGSANVREWLLNRARAFVFTTALPPSVCAASRTAIELVRTEPERRAHLLAMSERLKNGFAERGFAVADEVTPIIPLVVGSPDRALAMAQALRERGVLARAVRPPTVPEGTSRIRFVVQAGHTEAHVDRVLSVLDELEEHWK